MDVVTKTLRVHYQRFQASRRSGLPCSSLSFPFGRRWLDPHPDPNVDGRAVSTLIGAFVVSEISVFARKHQLWFGRHNGINAGPKDYRVIEI